MADERVATLKLSEVAKLCGVSIEVLRRLIDDEALDGAVRSNGGHVYLREDAVPTWQQVVDILETQFAVHTREAQAVLQCVQVEIEAVTNDLAEALENPHDRLGDDLMAFRSYSGGGSGQSTLSSALFRMEQAVWDVRLYSDAIRQTRRAV